MDLKVSAFELQNWNRFHKTIETTLEVVLQMQQNTARIEGVFLLWMSVKIVTKSKKCYPTKFLKLYCKWTCKKTGQGELFKICQHHVGHNHHSNGCLKFHCIRFITLKPNLKRMSVWDFWQTECALKFTFLDQFKNLQ